MKNKETLSLSRAERIILFLYEFSEKQKKRFTYEDLVVGLYKKYPEDFHLKGYPEYPDSGDSTQRTLYEFKKKGYINANNKIFTLTESGIDFAEGLKNKTDGLSIMTSDRLSRNTAVELTRIKLLEGFVIFCNGEKEKISESDFYAYMGTSAKTSKSIFAGRFETIKSVIQELKKKKDDELYKKVISYHEFLSSKYQNVINYFINR